MTNIDYKQLAGDYRNDLKGLVDDVCANLENPGFFIPYTEEELDLMFSDKAAVVGAFDKEKLIGFGVIILNDDFGGLDGAMTLRDYRNQGIQTEMIRRRLQIAKKHGLRKVIVKVHPDNKASLQAIRKNGFQEKETVMSHGCLRILFEIML